MTPPTPFSIAVLHQKGGVGKTTLATNLAAAFQLAGKRTLLVDLDRQGTALDWNHKRREGSALSGLSTVKFDRTLALTAFRTLARPYEVVILDGPPRLGEITRAAAGVVDLVLMPVQASPFDLWATDDTLALLDEADKTRAELDRAPVRRFFVQSKILARTSVARASEKVLTRYGDVLSTVLHQRVAYVEAAMDGESVLTVCPTDKAAFEMRALMRELQHVMGAN